jgi:hypothetical protein
MDCQSMDFVLWTRLFGGKLSAIATSFRQETQRYESAEDFSAVIEFGWRSASSAAITARPCVRL